MKIQRQFWWLFPPLISLACRPVLTIGWGEILIFAGLVLILLGPTFWRFYRRYRKFSASEKENRRK